MRTVVAILLAALAAFNVSYTPLGAQIVTMAVSLPATVCTNQFIRSIAVNTGIGTCASIAAGDFPALTGDVTTPGGSLATTLAASARLKSKIITGTRDLTVASGSVGYTGVGFQPTACLATGMVAASLTQYQTGFGMADSAKAVFSYNLYQGTQTTSTNFLLFGDVGGTNYQLASIASYDADGFTLSWTKGGTPTGTATFYVMCFR